MKKGIISFLLIIAIFCGILIIPTGATPEGTAISTPADFEGMVSGEQYYLANDIDFAGKVYECYILKEFSGQIDGCGFSIFNYSLNNNGIESDTGTFLRANEVSNLVIKDLNVGKPDIPVKQYVTASGKSHGVLFGAQQNSNNASLTNVNVYADIEAPTEGKCNVSGYVGYSRAISFNNCSMNGSIKVGSGIDKVDILYHNAGGFIGSANSSLTDFDNCVNNAEIITYCSTVEARAAGFVSYAADTVFINNSTNNGNITCYDTTDQKSSSQVAGFIAHANKTSGTMITNSTNNGDITGTYFCAAFIANVSYGASLERCVNTGKYSKDAVAYGPFYGNIAIADSALTDVYCLDATDPTATTPAYVETTTTPVTTKDPLITTKPPVTTKPTTTNPPLATDKPTTTTQEKPSKSCGSTIISPFALIFLSTMAGIVFIKKKV